MYCQDVQIDQILNEWLGLFLTLSQAGHPVVKGSAELRQMVEVSLPVHNILLTTLKFC